MIFYRVIPFGLTIIFIMISQAAPLQAAALRIQNDGLVFDQAGRKIEIKHPFGRVISLYGAHTENLFSLDVKNGASQSQIFGFGIPYADEYRENTVDYAMLERIASITGGRLLKPDENPAGLFSTDSETRESTTPLWPYLALASLLLFILDIIVRRLYTLGRIT